MTILLCYGHGLIEMPLNAGIKLRQNISGYHLTALDLKFCLRPAQQRSHQFSSPCLLQSSQGLLLVSIPPLIQRCSLPNSSPCLASTLTLVLWCLFNSRFFSPSLQPLCRAHLILFFQVTKSARQLHISSPSRLTLSTRSILRNWKNRRGCLNDNFRRGTSNWTRF